MSSYFFLFQRVKEDNQQYELFDYVVIFLNIQVEWLFIDSLNGYSLIRWMIQLQVSVSLSQTMFFQI